MKRIIGALLLCLLPSLTLAFPDNGVLENFTGSDDTSPPNANWTNGFIGTGSVGLRIRSNSVTTVTNITEGSGYWNPTTFNAAQEAYISITGAVSNGWVGVAGRLANIGSNTTDGYYVFYFQDGKIYIGRLDNGVETDLTTGVAQTLTADDLLGLRMEGDQICSWFWHGGSWAQVECTTDGTYSAGGKIGIFTSFNNTSAIIDNFGGGNIAVASTRKPQAPILLQ